MDKADIAIAISLLAASFTGWQAYIGHRTFRLLRAQSRRSPPIFETSFQPLPDRPGWHHVTTIVRNREAVTLLVNSVRLPSRRKAGLMHPGTVSTEMGGTADDTAALMPHLAKPVLEMNERVAPRDPNPPPAVDPASPISSLRRRLHPSGVSRLQFYLHGPVPTSALIWDWAWADGKS